MRLITLLLLIGLIACKQEPTYESLEENTSQFRDEQLAPFYHGVASGDPLSTGIVLWTRVTPATQVPEIEVEWEISEDENFQEVALSGKEPTSPDRDYTVKIDIIEGLVPGTQYYYRFKALEGTSMTGKTRTAPQLAERLRFAVVSCSNYEFGYFNAYARIAEEENLSAVVHLGDYIYEYGPGVYGDTTIGRLNIPPHEIISLQDYRDRYAQYRLDPDLRAVHANHPFINIWDDHEITNNSYKDGAENHQADEGDYNTRKAIARQVYYEWLPIRDGAAHYRAFSFGDLADLIMLDERLAGRTKQVDSLSDATLQNVDRSMLGTEQLAWFQEQLASSKARWKLIGNQVIFSYLDWGFPTFSINLDAWDGYPAEQQKVADFIKDNELKNLVFLTGDTHSSWAFEVTNNPKKEYNSSTSEGAFAVEFGVTSINSSNSNERAPTADVLKHEKKIVNTEINPHLKYANMRDHGYMVLELDAEKAQVSYKYVETLRKRDKGLRTETTLQVNSGEVKLQKLD